MITKEYLQQELVKRIDGYKRGVETSTDNIVAEMKSILVLVNALPNYEKKYKEALEKAKFYYDNWPLEYEKNKLENMFPELRESEDEMIRRTLVEYFGLKVQIDLVRGIPIQKIRDWLEKQKENPKNADSILADCASNAKCEDGWHKTANSLPDNGRDVLAKDALGNYLLASFDGAQWFVSVYDGEDHPVLHTPPILKWCEIPSEKQKEQNPAEDIKDQRQIYFMIEDGRRCGVIEGRKQVIDNPEKYGLQKPAEWSEEDEDKLYQVMGTLLADKTVALRDTPHCKALHEAYDEMLAWLKDLRPSWKPSEDQMDALKELIDDANRAGWVTPGATELYEQLKKL